MLLPRVLKIQDDELLYGWYERILQENRIEGNKGEETRLSLIHILRKHDIPLNTLPTMKKRVFG